MWRKVNDPANPDVDEDTWWRIFSADEESLPKQPADWKKSTMIRLKWAKGGKPASIRLFSYHALCEHPQDLRQTTFTNESTLVAPLTNTGQALL